MKRYLKHYLLIISILVFTVPSVFAKTRVESVKNTNQIYKDGKWVSLSENRPMDFEPKESIRTGNEGAIKVDIDDNKNEVRVYNLTVVKIEKIDSRFVDISVKNGKLYIRVTPDEVRKVRIRTLNAVIDFEADASGDFRIEFDPVENGTWVKTINAKVIAYNSKFADKSVELDFFKQIFIPFDEPARKEDIRPYTLNDDNAYYPMDDLFGVHPDFSMEAKINSKLGEISTTTTNPNDWRLNTTKTQPPTTMRPIIQPTRPPTTVYTGTTTTMKDPYDIDDETVHPFTPCYEGDFDCGYQGIKPENWNVLDPIIKWLKHPWPTRNIRVPEKIFFHLEGQTGPILINETLYGQIVLLPTFNIGPVELQLRIPFFLNPGLPIDVSNPLSFYNGNEWDLGGSGDLLSKLATFLFSKIEKVEYGEKIRFIKRDPTYMKLGTLEHLSFGTGFIVRDYSNYIEYPQKRRVGLELDFNYKAIGLETFIPDLSRTKIFGTRFFFDIAKILEVGTSIVYDADPRSNGGSNGGDPRVFNMGLDLVFTVLREFPGLEIPTYNPDSSETNVDEVEGEEFEFDDASDTTSKDPFIFKIFGNVATDAFLFSNPNHADNDATGEGNIQFPSNFGISFGFDLLIGDVFPFKFEYRFLLGGYYPEYYGPFYEVFRSSQWYNLVNDNTDRQGMVIQTGINFSKQFNFIIYYSEIFGITSNQLHLEMNMFKGFVDGFYFSVNYDKLNVVGIDGLITGFFKDYILSISLNYEHELVDVSLIYRHFFSDNNGDGVIATDFSEVSDSWQLQSTFYVF